jgi:hypothetical protein
MLSVRHPNPSEVIVSTEGCACQLIKSLCAHHRAIPEIRGEGETPRGAADKLIAGLLLALDYASDDWHRSYIECAIEDIRAFIEQAP